MRVFFSYCHQDEDLRDQLESHLSMLKRDGSIETWHDRKITAGDEWKGKIDEELERAEVILLLVSPGFLASDYCFDVEMKRAMQRHEAGQARVMPIILKPCDWHHALFARLQAAPRDGKPIISWDNQDEAFLNVVQMIRAVISPVSKQKPKASQIPDACSPNKAGIQSNLSIEQNPRSSNLRLKKIFTEADCDRFLENGFEFISSFFQNSLSELQAHNKRIETIFRRVDGNRFTAIIYQDGKAVTRCKITLGATLQKGISYSENDQLNDNSLNENMSVASDDQSLYLKALGMPMVGGIGTQAKLTFESGAEYYWKLFLRGL